MRLYTTLEIVLAGDSGRVEKLGVVRTSGVTAFDIGALESVMKAAPFGKAPAAIVSADGKVYVHWEFHRDPLVTCTSANARPFLLTRKP
jgi:outer membrane biosynthesis protein TonB